MATTSSHEATHLQRRKRNERGPIGSRRTHQRNGHRWKPVWRKKSEEAGVWMGNTPARMGCRRWERELRSTSSDGASVSNHVEDAKVELMRILGDESGKDLAGRNQANRRVEDLVQFLMDRNPTPKPNRSERLPGKWSLICTYKPGEKAADFFSLQSWKEYLLEGGPSPVQSLVVGNQRSVTGISQVLYLPEQVGGNGGTVETIVEFSSQIKGTLCLKAVVESLEGEKRIRFRFDGGHFRFTHLPFLNELGRPVEFPYPVPFRLLGKKAQAWLDTVYMDEDLRIAIGNRGSVFLLVPEAT